jgi:hypothetical protein
MLPGIQFVTDAKGKKVAVQLDLRKYGDLWEDIYDNIVAESRAKEPRVSFETVKRRLKRQGKI